jgi:membrane-associated phospholipid phosphatase
LVVQAIDFYQPVNDFARQTGWLHGPVTAYATYGIVLFAGLLLMGWWLARAGSARAMAAALLAPISTVLAIAVNQPIVKQVAEVRPYVAHPTALVLVSRSADPSFPSDHATMTGAVAVGLLLVSWRIGLIAIVCAVLMAASRVYVGAHYPQDVVAGLILGAAVALLVYLALRVPITRLVIWLRTTKLKPLFATKALTPSPVPA